MPMAEVNDVRLRYTSRGQGPPLLMIMGYRLPADAWPESLLSRLASHRRLILFDNRGTGRSGKPVAGYRMDELAEDAAGLLDVLGIGQTAVVGYSMGGCVAQELALAHPARVTSLVLAATLCGRSGSVHADPSIMRYLRMDDDLSAQDFARTMWDITYAPEYLTTSGAAAEAQLERETAWPTPNYVGDLQFQGLTLFDSWARLPAIRCPTLAVTGSADRLVPPVNSRIIAERIPGCRHAELAGRGHRVFWEAPEETAAIVLSFLQHAAEEIDA